MYRVRYERVYFHIGYSMRMFSNWAIYPAQENGLRCSNPQTEGTYWEATEAKQASRLVRCANNAALRHLWETSWWRQNSGKHSKYHFRKIFVSWNVNFHFKGALNHIFWWTWRVQGLWNRLNESSQSVQWDYFEANSRHKPASCYPSEVCPWWTYIFLCAKLVNVHVKWGSAEQ